MRRHIVKVLGLAALAALAALVVVPAWWREPARRINAASAQQIKPGMTLAEVEAILGYPPGNYARADSHTRKAELCGLRPPPPLGSSDLVWISDAGELALTVDGENIIVYCSFTEFVTPGLWAQMCGVWTRLTKSSQ